MSGSLGSWRALFGALFFLALLACAAHLGWLPEVAAGVVHKASALLVFFGAAAPLLRRLAPAEPAPLKLLLFSVLLSPILMVAVWLGWRAVTRGDAIGLPLALTFLTAALFQIVGVCDSCAPAEKTSPASPLGRAPIAALAIAIAFAGLVATIVFGEAAIRVSFHGLLHTSILEATAAGVPPENPWLAGAPLQYYWIWHALGSLVASSLWIAPTLALASLNVWAAFCLPLALYFLGAPLWRSAGMDLGGVLLGLFGLNLIGGWLWLLAGAPFDGATNPLAILQSNFGVLVGDGDLRLAWGPSKFGNMSSYPAALALLVSGWLAAAHALAPRSPEQHASLRVWSLLAALCLGACFAVNPLVGAAGFGGTGLALLLLRDFSKPKLQFLGMLGVAVLPGLIEVLLAGRGRQEASFTFGFGGVGLGSTLIPILPLLALAVLPLVRRPWAARGGEQTPNSEQASGARNAVLVLLAASAAVSLALALFVQLPLDNQYKFVRTAQVCLGLLAAGGLGQLIAWRGPGQVRARAAGVLALGLLAIGAASSSVLGARSFFALSASPLPLAEIRSGVQPTGTSDAAQAMAWLRAAAPSLATDAGRGVLVLNPPFEGEPSMDFGGTHFGTRGNLQGHGAAAFSGLSLFVDRRFYLVDTDYRWAPRLGLVQAFFRGEDLAAQALAAALGDLGRPTLILTEGQVLSPEAIQTLDLEVLGQFGEIAVLGGVRERELLGSSTGTLQD
ncbi:MAG: hypothetical protein ACI9D0_000921 [Bacteroidia bacterium]